MKKERPLTAQQCECLRAAEDTLFGLRKRGLVEGEMPHVYLTDTGRSLLAEIAQ